MNLSLDLADGLPGLRQRGGVETSIARFQQWMADPDSPIRAIRRQAAREGEYADIPEAVGPVVRRMLEARGIPRLYTHQAEAFRLCLEGKNVVVVTPTASGKTLCYNLPILKRLVEDPGSGHVSVSHQGSG
jgi:DEAD/DEAH box helicase domain-containing protein